jgi:DNA-binding NtrC family response regulator
LEITDEAMKALQSNEWKGNIRELENCIERAVILAEDDRIETRHLLLSPDTKNVQLLQTLAVMPTEGESRLGRRRTDSAPLPTLREAEQNLIARALDRADGDESAAAEMLDITPEQLQEKRSLKAEPKKRKK